MKSYLFCILLITSILAGCYSEPPTFIHVDQKLAVVNRDTYPWSEIIFWKGDDICSVITSDPKDISSEDIVKKSQSPDRSFGGFHEYNKNSKKGQALVKKYNKGLKYYKT